MTVTASSTASDAMINGNRTLLREKLEEKIRRAQEGPARDELKSLIVSGIEAERAGLDQTFTQPIPQASSANKIFSCGEFISADHGQVQPLIGSEKNALLVRGEGWMIPGVAGVGKTFFLASIGANLAAGENVLKWHVETPLRVLIYQAELPIPFFQQRIKALVDSYALADRRKADLLRENIFIADVKRPFDISADNDGEFDRLREEVEKLKIDVLMIDPFLSFFQGNENDNCQVRRSLDNLKRCVAAAHSCGLIITDHMPKYSGSEKHPEQQYSMRGAGAKRDWAATVLALTAMKTPEGQHGTFIRATVDKMRYGKVPKDPFNLRRDDFSFRYEWFKSCDIEPHQIAEVLDSAGGGLSLRTFKSAVADTLALSDHEARRLIEHAISEGWIDVTPGERRSKAHNLSDKYIRWRDDQ